MTEPDPTQGERQPEPRPTNLKIAAAEREKSRQRPPRAPQGYGGRTDLSALDQLGMSVAMSYELNRVAATTSVATIFDPALEAKQPDGCVFNISGPARIAVARARSAAFGRVMHYVAGIDVNAIVIGCDIMMLVPAGSAEGDGIDRRIVLTSSGHDARIKNTTCNEWNRRRGANNCGRASTFYLWRIWAATSPEARPHLRAVRDSFGAMRAE